jgi:hypothetical protein
MDLTVPITPENMSVILRVRPRIDLLPHHPQYTGRLVHEDHNPDCIFCEGPEQVKLIPPAQCKCDYCFAKYLASNGAPEKFGSSFSRDQRDKYFCFNNALDAECSQEDVYKCVSDLIFSTVEGYNTAIFAYGASGTGKTYTMAGTKHAPGLIPRTVRDLFDVIASIKGQRDNIMFNVEMSYIDIYNNMFRNLLKQISDEIGRLESNGAASELLSVQLAEILRHGVSDSAFEAGLLKVLPNLTHKLDKITVHEGVHTGVFVCGQNLRIPIKSAEDAIQLVEIGEHLRRFNAPRGTDGTSRYDSA